MAMLALVSERIAPDRPRNCFTVPVHKAAAVLVGICLLCAACVTGERPVLTGEMLPSTTMPEDEQGALPAASETTTSVAEPTVSEQVAREDARALVTPTGVIVPVLEVTPEEFVIRTPCGETSSLTLGTPIAVARVVLDPGHGGEESGAVGPNGLQEKDLNLEIAQRAMRKLEERGISVVLARTDDYRIPLSTRAEIGNRLGAEVMVSIHHNAPNWLDSNIPGSEIFVQSGSTESRRLGGLLYEEIVGALLQFDVAWTTNDDAGALAVLNSDGEDAYGMIRRPEMPAVLAEFGYLSNPAEADLFLTDEYRDVAAEALAAGIERYLFTDDPGSGFVDEPRIFTPDGSTGGSGGCIDPPLE